MKIILSGGGTAGHIYPAVAVAEELSKYPDVELLFVGALGKMEMELVPRNGYKIKGLPIAGLQRRLTLSNLALPFKLIKSMIIARNIIREFRPDVVVGFGGYASGPILKAAQKAGIPTVIQEQNSYPGVTNRLLAANAYRICTAYTGLESVFPPSKIVITGNPLRGNFTSSDRPAAFIHWNLDPSKKTILVTGGSLGTRTLNEMMIKYLETRNSKNSIQVLWQTGRYYAQEIDRRVESLDLEGVTRFAFTDRMDYAYAAADLVICRSGACTVSELQLLSKATIFVPSPNVAEDHQTKNARNLSDHGAAWLVPDSEAIEKAMTMAENLLALEDDLAQARSKIKTMAHPDAAHHVAEIVRQAASSKGDS